MIARQQNRNLLDVIRANRSLAADGIRAEAVGRQSIRISRAGRLMGIWREALGSYEWYPAGNSRPEHRAVTCDDAMRYFGQYVKSAH